MSSKISGPCVIACSALPALAAAVAVGCTTDVVQEEVFRVAAIDSLSAEQRGELAFISVTAFLAGDNACPVPVAGAGDPAQPPVYFWNVVINGKRAVWDSIGQYVFIGTHASAGFAVDPGSYILGFVDEEEPVRVGPDAGADPDTPKGPVRFETGALSVEAGTRYAQIIYGDAAAPQLSMVALDNAGAGARVRVFNTMTSRQAVQLLACPDSYDGDLSVCTIVAGEVAYGQLAGGALPVGLTRVVVASDAGHVFSEWSATSADQLIIPYGDRAGEPCTTGAVIDLDDPFPWYY